MHHVKINKDIMRLLSELKQINQIPKTEILQNSRVISLKNVQCAD